MEFHNESRPQAWVYMIVGLIFVTGLCLAASFLGAMSSFTPQDWAEMAGMQAEIPERVSHLETMNQVQEEIAQGTQTSEIEKSQAWNEGAGRVYRATGLVIVLLAAAWGGSRAWRIYYEERQAERERRAAAGLKEVQADKGKDNPAFTPAGFLTRTTTIEGETFVSSDLTGEMVPVRDPVRMQNFRDAHLAAMMAAIAAKRDVLIARASRASTGSARGDDNDVILIGEGL